MSDDQVDRSVRFAYGECGEMNMTYQAHSAADDDERTIRPATAPGFELDEIRTAVKGIRYGEVRLIIQDGVIIQIDRVEKRRLR